MNKLTTVTCLCFRCTARAERSARWPTPTCRGPSCRARSPPSSVRSSSPRRSATPRRRGQHSSFCPWQCVLSAPGLRLTQAVTWRDLPRRDLPRRDLCPGNSGRRGVTLSPTVALEAPYAARRRSLFHGSRRELAALAEMLDCANARSCHYISNKHLLNMYTFYLALCAVYCGG